MNDLDHELSQALRRRAESMRSAPLAFDDVRGRATSIRRRRNVATGVAVAAAVAVIVPVAFLTSKNVDSDGQLPATQPPTAVTDTADPSPTPTSTPVMGEPHVLDARGLPTGALPAIGYVADGTDDASRLYVDIDGLEIRLQSSEVRIAGPEGTVATYASESGLAVDDSHTVVAWVTTDGVVMAWQQGASEVVELGTTDLVGPQAEAVTGTDCDATSGDCRVWLRGSKGPSYEPASEIVAADGVVEPVAQLVQVRDASDIGLAVGSTRILSDGSCSALLEIATGNVRFETCDYQLDAISPSGDHVLASEPWHSGNLNGKLAVLDARTGEVLATRTSARAGSAFYDQAVWEDDGHVLFTAFQDGKWSVVRMTVEGALEFAVAPAELGDELARPFTFETR